ncbi:MAG TPA: DoxX family protein [Solirubrobacteraceae bacterium]|nr:DoxX family protein [Solirubrobacteraceae bacterium]
MASAQQQGEGRGLSRRVLASFFVLAGANHFLVPRWYEAIVPPRLRGDARRIVQLSGVAEIAGGVGVLVPATRRAAGVGLVALLAAVFPANVHMAREPQRFARFPRWALYARLPLQPLMMLWAWKATRR